MKKSTLLGLVGVILVIALIGGLLRTPLLALLRSTKTTTTPQPLANTGAVIEPIPFAKEFEYTATQSGQTALDLLKANAILEVNAYDFGTMITGIDGLVANQKNYWAFYLNGEYAKQAVDKTELKIGDKIKFVYEVVSGAPALENK